MKFTVEVSESAITKFLRGTERHLLHEIGWQVADQLAETRQYYEGDAVWHKVTHGERFWQGWGVFTKCGLLARDPVEQHTDDKPMCKNCSKEKP